MAASETVRLRLQFDYPPPATPHCTDFWLLADLNRCRVVTDLISLIRERFGFSSGAPLGLYLEGGLLPHGESARLVRDNDCLRVKLEEREVAENPVLVSNGDGTNLLPRKAKKRSFKLEEDQETDYRHSKKPWKRQENSNEDTLDLELKAITDESVKKKSKRKNKATCDVVDDDDGVDEEMKKKSPRTKEKRVNRKQTKNSKSSKAQMAKEWTVPKGSPSKGSPARNSLVKAKRKGGVDIHAKNNPSSSSESESCHESISDGLSNVIVEVRKSSEEISAALLQEGPSVKNSSTNKLATKITFNSIPIEEDKTARTSSSSSDSSSESEDESVMPKRPLNKAAGLLKAAGPFAGRGCPGPGLSSQTPHAVGWKHSDSNGGRHAPGPPPNVTLPTSLGRGWGRGEDHLSHKGVRGRGARGRGRGRGLTLPGAVNRNADCQKQPHLNEVLSNSSTIIQNPVETHKKDYSLLPLLAAAPQVGERIAFKLLELTSDYSPNVSDYKEGKILSQNPETQQVDIEILSSLPACMVIFGVHSTVQREGGYVTKQYACVNSQNKARPVKEPGKFDLVYHNENGTEVVEYAVTQERRITVFWRELIDPRLIVESSNNTSSMELA